VISVKRRLIALRTGCFKGGIENKAREILLSPSL